MEIQQTYKFPGDDIKLLRHSLPRNPCINCRNDNGDCCGCPDEHNYHTALKPYKEANLLEFAEKICEIRSKISNVSELSLRISKLQQEIKNDLADLPKELQEVIHYENDKL